MRTLPLSPRFCGDERKTTAPSATVGTLRRRIAAELRASFAKSGRDGTPDLDARLIVAHAIGCDPSDVVLGEDRAVDEGIVRQAMDFAARRIAGEPVARIVGHKEFYGLDLKLTPATLVPRPDTETLVDAAIDVVEGRWGREAPVRIVDLGTGSGAILLALLCELPGACGVGVDLSREAATTARDNARRLGLAERALFVVGEWSETVGAADVVVANPPYIETGVIATLASEVREHDPRLALDGGDDGLDAIRTIVGDLGRVLADDGSALIEIGSGQGEAVRDIAESAGFAARLERDLAGSERVAIVARRHQSVKSR
jgi:release factor glutamine methyltransferase